MINQKMNKEIHFITMTSMIQHLMNRVAQERQKDSSGREERNEERRAIWLNGSYPMKKVS